jgi:hypothetical protein
MIEKIILGRFAFDSVLKKNRAARKYTINPNKAAVIIANGIPPKIKVYSPFNQFYGEKQVKLYKPVSSSTGES